MGGAHPLILLYPVVHHLLALDPTGYTLHYPPMVTPQVTKLLGVLSARILYPPVPSSRLASSTHLILK
jgi:hypothetical protein